jgi:NADH:ubiquinone oxidoreductase subunit 6 (subunit J)
VLSIPILFADEPPDRGLSATLAALANLWRLWLPLVVGAAAIFLLLPRPRAYPVLWGIVAGAAALVLGGALLVGAPALNPETVLFYVFSAIAIVSGALLITQHNPARAALSFTLVVLSTCGIFLLLAAPFLMAATIIIYAGAIVVTFLFVLMLAQQVGLSDADARSREPLLATATGFILLGALLFVLQQAQTKQQDVSALEQLEDRIRQALAAESREEMDRIVGVSEQPGYLFADARSALTKIGYNDLEKDALRASFVYLDPTVPESDKRGLHELENVLARAEARAGHVSPRIGRTNGPAPDSPLSGPPASTPPSQMRRDPETRRPHMPAESSAFLGRSLFTDYLLPVELAGLLLLVAAIGAIAIAHRRAVERPS